MDDIDPPTAQLGESDAPSQQHPGKVLRRATRLRIVLPLSLALTVAVTAVAIRSRHDVAATETVPPSDAALPAANETCTAIKRWGDAISDAASVGGPAIGAAPTLAGKRAAVVGLVELERSHTQQLIDELDATGARYREVSGVEPYVALLRQQFDDTIGPLNEIVAQARALPIDSDANFDTAKSALVEAHGQISSGLLDEGHLHPTRAMASAAMTFQSAPACAGLLS